MQTAIITVIFETDKQKCMDLEIPLDISLNACVDILQTANWLPDAGHYHYQVSGSGEEWIICNGDKCFLDLIDGDGALLKIIPFKQ